MLARSVLGGIRITIMIKIRNAEWVVGRPVVSAAE